MLRPCSGLETEIGGLLAEHLSNITRESLSTTLYLGILRVPYEYSYTPLRTIFAYSSYAFCIGVLLVHSLCAPLSVRSLDGMYTFL